MGLILWFHGVSRGRWPRDSELALALEECGTGKSRSVRLRLVPMHSFSPSPWAYSPSPITSISLFPSLPPLPPCFTLDRSLTPRLRGSLFLQDLISFGPPRGRPRYGGLSTINFYVSHNYIDPKGTPPRVRGSRSPAAAAATAAAQNWSTSLKNFSFK